MTIYTDTSPQPTGPTLSIIHISQFPTLGTLITQPLLFRSPDHSWGRAALQQMLLCDSKGGKIRCEPVRLWAFLSNVLKKRVGGEKRERVFTNETLSFLFKIRRDKIFIFGERSIYIGL